MLLHYPYEVRKRGKYFGDIPEEKAPKEMIDLAVHKAAGEKLAPVEHTTFQRLVPQVFGQRPTQADAAHPPQAVTPRRRADRQARRDLAFGHAAGTKPQHVA
jgi:hypothetical protein